jgi:hypothetical protein
MACRLFNKDKKIRRPGVNFDTNSKKNTQEVKKMAELNLFL